MADFNPREVLERGYKNPAAKKVLEKGNKDPAAKKALVNGYNDPATIKAMEKGYRDYAAKKANADKLIGGIKIVNKGATTFGEIDKWLSDNPNEQYFRIGNGGSRVKEARGYETGNGMWTDNDAAIVGQERDKGTRDIFRYANFSPMPPRQGKRGEKATVSGQYNPSSFFKDNGIDYNTQYGMIYSRDEYGKVKESAAKHGKGDRFLEAGQKLPEFSSDYGKDKGAILTGAGVDSNRRASLGQDETDGLDSSTDPTKANKRKLLG